MQNQRFFLYSNIEKISLYYYNFISIFAINQTMLLVITSFIAIWLFTRMWLTNATTGKPNTYFTIYINASNIILKNYY